MAHVPNQQVDDFDVQDGQDDAIFTGPVPVPVPLTRGRQPRDPQAKTITYNVTSLDDFEAALREYLTNPPDEPEHTECQLSFWAGSTFLVPAHSNQPQGQQQQQQQPPHFVQHPDAPPGYQSASGMQQQYGGPPNPYQSIPDPVIALALSNFQTSPPPTVPITNPNAGANGTSNNNTRKKSDGPRVPMGILDALQPTTDPKEKMRKQRTIAKCCVDAIQRTDGFRYSFHNCWNSREDNSFRFSYYCNDSLLNKDRAANGKGSKLGKRATKPVYDCKGVLSIKFSASKQSLDVFYKHNPVHKTYEERAPAPRKDSKRRKYLEENEPEALSRIQSRPKPARAESDGQPKSKKKKKQPEEQKLATSLESDLRAHSLRMLLELIRPDLEPEPSPPESPSSPSPPPPQQRQPSAPVPPPVPIQQQPQVQQQPRRRPRTSCDVCKAKKTKCDGTRPACNACIDKKRQCIYTEAGTGDTVPDPIESVRQAQAASNELSELEQMKKELEEARARIQELEEEQRRSSITPSQTPHMSRPPPPQAQPQSDAKGQPPTHPQKRQHQQHQQQHQQGQQQQQMQMQNTQQPQAIQQLQNAAQQLQTPQQMPNSQQLQTPQFNHFNPHAPNPYALNRPISSQNMTQNAGHATQSPDQQMHTISTGLTPPVEATNPYGREFTWPAAYYGYQSAQQHQPDQWATARDPGVFR